MSDAKELSPSEIKRIKRRRAWRSARPALLFGLLAILVILLWLGSISYIRHGLPGTHPRADRLEALALVGEAMTITNVLFAGLGFLALIVTVWFQRKQVESAIDGMTDQYSLMSEQVERMDDTLDVLRLQSAATLAAAQIGALSTLISVKEKEIEAIRFNAARGVSDPKTPRLPTLEKEQEERIANLEFLLVALREEIDKLYPDKA